MVNAVPYPRKIEYARELSPRIIRGRYPSPAVKLVIDFCENEDDFCAIFTYDSYEKSTIKNWADAFYRILLGQNPNEIIIPKSSNTETPKPQEVVTGADLADVWKEFFGTDSGNFYALGGTSLKAIQIEEAMLYRGLYISAADILKLQNFAEIASAVTAADEIDWEAD
jgi:hypothetical protein